MPVPTPIPTVRSRTFASIARRLFAALAAVALLAPVGTAHAGGLFLTDRGARPLGRGFAFVAGADDPGALWYNPAGIGGIGRQVFGDFTLTAFDGEYTRVDGGGNTLPTVSASPPPLPIPMLAYTDDFGLKKLTFGLGVFAPNAVLLDWPASIQAGGMSAPAPQRYSLITMKGSVLANIVAGVAYKPSPNLSIGIAPQLIVGTFASRVAMSACDHVACTQPENPDYDGLAQITAPILEPGLGAGITYQAGIVRMGASMTWWPWALSSEAQMTVRLPTAAFFDGAHIEGDRAHVSMPFPLILRGGVELRPTDRLRVEAALVYEGWSAQDAVRIHAENIWIRNAIAINDYQIGDVTIPRNMHDVISARLGGELTMLDSGNLVLRAGLDYATSSFDDQHLTALTLDSDKLVAGLGVSYRLGRGVWVDASYGHVFMRNRHVEDSQVPQPSPLRPPPHGVNPPDGPVYIGNGDYVMEADMFGLGLRWALDAPAPPEPAPETAAPPEAPPETSPPPSAPPPTQSAPPANTNAPNNAPWPPSSGSGGSNAPTPWYLRGRHH